MWLQGESIPLPGESIGKNFSRKLNDMKFLLSLPIAILLVIPTKTFASKPNKVNAACKSFADGDIDAFETLEALELDFDNYSIGVINIAKISCL